MDWGNRKDILVFLEQKDGKALNGALEFLAPAYVRFASVYRQFKDINSFMEELSKIINSKKEN